jgi:Leucine-rich repeat (LRR) protein
VDQIVVDDLGISDLTGIQDCPNLYNLWLQNNSVSTLDVSKNPKLQFIYADGNNLNDINMSGLPLLEKLSLRSNAFTQLDVSANTLLQLLELSGNVISEISLVTNEVLFRLDITENPLTCIEVNEDQLSNQDLEWTLDIDDRLALDCN